MADHMKRPQNVETTSTERALKTTPADKPTWKAGMGQEQITSTRMPLSHKATPVANLENKPGRHGTPQTTSTQLNLSRRANGPYDPVAKTTPETDL